MFPIVRNKLQQQLGQVFFNYLRSLKPRPEPTGQIAKPQTCYKLQYLSRGVSTQLYINDGFDNNNTNTLCTSWPARRDNISIPAPRHLSRWKPDKTRGKIYDVICRGMKTYCCCVFEHLFIGTKHSNATLYTNVTL